MLNSETRGLLDKLYDVKGDNSSLIFAMQEEKDNSILHKVELSKEREELRDKLELLTSEEKVLTSEGEDLKIALAKVSNDNFSKILNKLEIEFDPYALSREVERKLPLAIEEIATTKEETLSLLDNTEEELNNTILRIEELDIRHDELVANQLRLRHYFDLAMKSEINITRDEITSLLQTFNFDMEEAREIAKLLMFPEDGLFEYEESLNNKKVNKSISDIFNNAKEIVKEEIKETPIIEDIKIEKEEFIPDVEIVEAEEKETEIQEVTNKEVDKDTIIELFNNNGIDYLNFTNNDIDTLVKNYNEELFIKNINIINKLSINKDIFNDNVELLFDTELEDKLNILIDNGKKSTDIYLNPNILIKYNLSELKEAIDVLKENGLNPKDIPLMAY